MKDFSPSSILKNKNIFSTFDQRSSGSKNAASIQKKKTAEFKSFINLGEKFYNPIHEKKKSMQINTGNNLLKEIEKLNFSSHKR